GTKAGSKKPLLTIGTYPVPDAFAATRAVAAKADAVKLYVGGNGIAFYAKHQPTSVYLAYQGSDFQVEVYDSSPEVARKLVQSRAVKPVPGRSPLQTQSGGAHGLTLTSLKSYARSVGHPVYWVGARPGMTYEVTQTSAGQIYLRYLPPGVAVGTGTPYLTVGTYPLRDAFDATRRLAGKAGTVRMDVGSSAVAFYARARPTSIYEAFPGVDYQVELYDPSVLEARELATAGKIFPIG